MRDIYASHLSKFISAAMPADLRTLNQLTEGAVSSRPAILAIVGATIEDVTGAASIPDGVIVIDHGVITAQGPRKSFAIPHNATVLEGRSCGRTRIYMSIESQQNQKSYQRRTRRLYPLLNLS